MTSMSEFRNTCMTIIISFLLFKFKNFQKKKKKGFLNNIHVHDN